MQYNITWMLISFHSNVLNWFRIQCIYILSKSNKAEKLKSREMKEGWIKNDVEWCRMMKDEWKKMRDEGWVMKNDDFKLLRGFCDWQTNEWRNRLTFVNVELQSWLKIYISKSVGIPPFFQKLLVASVKSVKLIFLQFRVW